MQFRNTTQLYTGIKLAVVVLLLSIAINWLSRLSQRHPEDARYQRVADWAFRITLVTACVGVAIAFISMAGLA